MQNTTEVVPSKTLVPFGRQGVTLTSMEDAFRFAVAVSKSGFAPKGIETPEAILIAVQFGAELGLTPMSSLQSLAIINGRPAVYGDAALALVRASGFLESYAQSSSGTGDSEAASVTVKRKDEMPITCTFSVADAKKAGLWGKAGPWSQYPARMLMWRARGFALRDAFGDVLRGLRTVEEVEDLPPLPEKNVTPRVKVPKELKDAPAESPAKPEALTPDERREALEANPSTDNPEAQLRALIAKDKVTNKELAVTMKHYEIQVPAGKFEGVDSMNEKTISAAVSGWQILLDHILSEREKKGNAP
jgi:hypothetical protein